MDYKPAVSGPAKLIQGASPAFVSMSSQQSGKASNRTVSAGSTGHATGTCKACAHIWKPEGCAKGADCTFCHLCDEDDFKRRRKEKLNRLKAEKAKRKTGQASTGEADATPPGGLG